MTKLELADMLDRFAGNASDCGDWEWDDFTSVGADSELEPYRQRLLSEVDPLLSQSENASLLKARLDQIITELRADA